MAGGASGSGDRPPANQPAFPPSQATTGTLRRGYHLPVEGTASAPSPEHQEVHRQDTSRPGSSWTVDPTLREATTLDDVRLISPGRPEPHFTDRKTEACGSETLREERLLRLQSSVQSWPGALQRNAKAEKNIPAQEAPSGPLPHRDPQIGLKPKAPGPPDTAVSLHFPRHSVGAAEGSPPTPASQSRSLFFLLLPSSHPASSL